MITVFTVACIEALIAIALGDSPNSEANMQLHMPLVAPWLGTDAQRHAQAEEFQLREGRCAFFY